MKEKHRELPKGELELRFDGGFASVFMATLGIVATAPDFEGLEQWAYVAFAALSPELRRDIRTFTDYCGSPIVFARLTRERPVIDDFDAFIDWLASLPDDTIRSLLGSFFEAVSRKEMDADTVSTVAVSNQEDPADIARFIESLQTDWGRETCADAAYLREMAETLADPGRFRARMIKTCRAFWTAVYRDEYAQTQGLIERVIALHGRAAYPHSLPEAYLAITGKILPQASREAFADAHSATFVPCCYAGPYVRSIPVSIKNDQLLFVFNARGQTLETKHPAAALPSLFPPLKALADETRLQILAMLADGELYGQRIVDRLDISQPSVSRHLKLMVIAGVLQERKEGGRKLYSIREETLADITRQLGSLAAWAKKED